MYSMNNYDDETYNFEFFSSYMINIYLVYTYKNVVKTVSASKFIHGYTTIII